MAITDRICNAAPPILFEYILIERVDRQVMYYEPTTDPEPGAINFTHPVPSPPIRKDVYRQGSYCPLIYRPPPAGVVAQRAEYAAWRMGLQILAGELEGKLSAFAVLTPAAAWRRGRASSMAGCRSCSAASVTTRFVARPGSRRQP